VLSIRLVHQEDQMPTMEQATPTLKLEVADKYLKIYNADIDWEPFIREVHGRLTNQMSADEARAEIKKRLACTILLPHYEKNTIQDPPQNLLYYCHKWSQYSSRDWVTDLFSVMEKDQVNEKIRNKCLDLGVIFPLQYNPNTRQAFNWLYDEAEASGDLTPETKAAVVKKLQNLVYAYGGVVVCSVFSKPELKPKIKSFLNWRSGYFFERLIHEVYKEDELIKIKTHEINKIRNIDSKLVKKIKPKE
jgi:hypothetical protein